MMTSLKLVLYVTFLFLGKTAQTTALKLSSSVHQDRHFASAKAGDNVTLQCFYESSDPAWLFWYKQFPGQKPRLISTFYVYDVKTTFYNEFKNNPRFKLDTRDSTNHLTIYDLQPSDSATYYCASSYTLTLTFAEGIVVSVKGSGLNVQAQVHQSASETIQPGGSVTLNCTVHTGTCDGKHSVYWFKNSEESRPGLIYTHGDRNDRCERKPDKQSQSCVYNLQMENLNRSDAGNYYCAAASCGHILFGNGTKLNIKHEVNTHKYLVYFLSGALTFTTILTVLLSYSAYKIMKKNNCLCTKSGVRLSAPSTENAERQRDADSLHYAALNVTLPNGSRRQRDSTTTECVYSRVRK